MPKKRGKVKVFKKYTVAVSVVNTDNEFQVEARGIYEAKERAYDKARKAGMATYDDEVYVAHSIKEGWD